MDVVYWNGEGSPNAFRTCNVGACRASWRSADPSEGCIRVTDTYEDPYFSASSVAKVGRCELEYKAKEGCMHKCTVEKYDSGTVACATGQWWPVWLLARTRTGWWAVCWVQLRDGMEVWWYHESHIVLMHARL